MLKQAIDLPGVENARELGGYAVGGRRIKKGALLRTAGLGGISEETVVKLQNEYSLRTVIDFRMTNERAAVPDPEIPGARNIHLPVIEFEDYPVNDPKLVEEYEKCGDRMQVFELAYSLGMLGPQ